jgi:hypothetical protein
MLLTRWSWTQPVCSACYAEHEPGRVPFRMREAESERCCFCNRETKEGIYYRVDPRLVPFPTREKE